MAAKPLIGGQRVNVTGLSVSIAMPAIPRLQTEEQCQKQVISVAADQTSGGQWTAIR
jgi:hypothetical protein